MKIAISIIVLLLNISCINKKVHENMQQSEITTVYKGSLFGAGAEGFTKENIVIRTEKEWQEVLNKLNTTNNVSEQFKGTIDFTKNNVIIAVDNVRNTGGFSINIDEVLDKKDATEISVVTKGPGPSDNVIMAITQPIHIVLINKTNKEIVFLEK
ncbi:protease complex subunit PrcB family protein [Tenacibaculum amylolyticum]|uniref:protease complex subunit PrcB family protein n=1 Tax=Tenacibaculum amylolyticum TaxID=104269 RepID=UPI003895236F